MRCGSGRRARLAGAPGGGGWPGGARAAAAAVESARPFLGAHAWPAAPGALELRLCCEEVLPRCFELAHHATLEAVLAAARNEAPPGSYSAHEESVGTRVLRDSSTSALLGLCDAGTTLTGVVGLGDGHLLCAQAGDSEVALFPARGAPTWITALHSAAGAGEVARVTAAGASVVSGRFHIPLRSLGLVRALAPSRSLGHPCLSRRGITHAPFCRALPSQPGDALVLASDGLWDEATASGARFWAAAGGLVAAHRGARDADGAAAALLALAVNSRARARRDNAAVVVAYAL
jgi:serine/threonine protein phosphatase PrpC